jgi:transposase
MIPRKRGDRQKNDKRDAASLAVLHRGGLLTAVCVSDTPHEAMRDLIRSGQAAVRALRTARQQLSAFLLRHERIYSDGRSSWTKASQRDRGQTREQKTADALEPGHRVALSLRPDGGAERDARGRLRGCYSGFRPTNDGDTVIVMAA